MRSTRRSARSRARAIAPDSGFFVITSRCSFEMVAKAAIFGAGTLVAVSAPTSLALERAQRFGVRLIAVARRDQALCFEGGRTKRAEDWRLDDRQDRQTRAHGQSDRRFLRRHARAGGDRGRRLASAPLLDAEDDPRDHRLRRSRPSRPQRDRGARGPIVERRPRRPPENSAGPACLAGRALPISCGSSSASTSSTA